MPWDDNFCSNAVVNYNYSINLGTLQIKAVGLNGVSTCNVITRTARIVIISATNRMKNPKVNWDNYDEAAKALNL